MTPEESYEIYKQQRATRQAEQQAIKDDIARQHRQIRDAYENLPVHTATHKAHVCHKCGGAIPVGSQYRSASQVINTSSRGYTFTMTTAYYCLSCKPLKSNLELQEANLDKLKNAKGSVFE